METYNKEQEIPAYKFLMLGLIGVMIVALSVFWVTEKKNVSWKYIYEKDIQTAIMYVEDTTKRKELIEKLKK